MPIELPMERTSAASPQARATRIWVRRARMVGGAVGVAALGLLSAASVVSVGARARARATRLADAPPPPVATSAGSAQPAAPGAGTPSQDVLGWSAERPLAVRTPPADVSPSPAWPADVPAAAMSAAESPPGVPVTSLPVASSGSSKLTAAARRATPLHSHATSKVTVKASTPATRATTGTDARTDLDAPGKTMSPFDAIGGRE